MEGACAPVRRQLQNVGNDRGERREFPGFAHDVALAHVRQALRGWREAYSRNPDQLAALLLTEVFAKGEPEAPGTGMRHEASVAPE